jgi:chemotaxis protein methyltransferase WspC
MTMPKVEAVIRERLGLDPAALGPSILPRTIENRMKAEGETGLEAYLERLANKPYEIDILAEELVVSETWFFRGGHTLYKALAQFVVDCIASHPTGIPIRVLSIPCSTGEEPLSLAIAIHRCGIPTDKYVIDAIDLSQSHVERAKAGIYSSFAFREPGLDLRPSYFNKIGSNWTPLPHIKQTVHYRTGNIVDPALSLHELPYDLILCRNLFIYLTADGRKKAFAALDRLLSREGCFCVTSAEADRLPTGQFVSEGPIEFGLYRRIETDSSFVSDKQIPSIKLKPNATPQATFFENPSSKKPFTSLPSHSDTTPELDRSGPPDPTSTTTPGKGGPDCNALDKARDLANAGLLSEARVACEEAIRTQTELPEAYSLLGVIHQAEGRVPEAAEAFRKTLYLAPNHVETLTHLIVLCNARGDTTQATVLQKRLKKLTPEDPA